VGCAGKDGDVGAAGFAEDEVEDFGAGFGIAEGGGDAEDLELGAFEGDGEGVVDVGVDGDLLRCG